uniref:DIOX_N domain-containing protein n=1 Tax=Elaeophora elaphi TaxID=1147741 RepID=A0A0R3S2C8_9BILA
LTSEFGVPLCRDDNNVREKFERLLEKKLTFSIRHVSSIDYLKILSQPLRFNLRRMQRRLHSEGYSGRHHRHQQQFVYANSIFHSEFYTDDFYKQFLKIYVQ